MDFDWKNVAGKIASHAPLLGTLLGGPAGAIVGATGSLIASKLGVEATPEAVETELGRNPERLIEIQMLEEENEQEYRMAVLRASERQDELAVQAQANVNKTIRTELQSDDEYVRRTRPRLVRRITDALVALIIGPIVTVVLITGALIFGAEIDVAAVVQAQVSLVTVLMIPVTTGLTVAGVYVSRRSTHDKPVAAGMSPDAPDSSTKALMDLVKSMGAKRGQS